ncbi:MAG: 23S rRNA (guanosine(2251)-2'-O)-methyltransferase RlmB [Pseudomonadota bacterium]|jgi:23S rRNA (guanosine2251-2'-O)-methyltransferase|nr:23S rRNA (guanosine(2251)-2'-O)-methyltransferase RlmB [Alphaproteobacteria bacterium]
MTYWMYGWHACQAALNNPIRKIEKILLDKRQDPAKLQLNRKIPLEKVDTKIIEQKVGKESVHQGITICAHELLTEDISFLSADVPMNVAILDQITDPHNVGAIWRSCAVFGITAIVTTERNSAPESGALAKSASGALEFVPRIEVKNLAASLAELKEYGFWIYGFSEHSKATLQKFSFAKKTALIFGNEGDGMRSLTMKNCDETLQLPTSKNFQTLNVSNAAAIALYEVFKQTHS